MKLVRTPRISSLRHALAFAAALPCFTACGSGGAGPDGPKAETGQIRVGNPSARGCEALLAATEGEVLGVEFGPGATGKLIREGDRAGLSFISTSAAALPASPGTLRFTGEVKVLSSACYGESGESLAGDGVQL